MRLIINILVSIATIFQFLVSCINVLKMKKPETLGDSFYNYFVLIGCFCSFIVGILFVVTYNFRYKLLDSKIINLFLLLIIEESRYDIQSAKIKKINHSRHIGTAADIGTGIALLRVKAESSTEEQEAERTYKNNNLKNRRLLCYQL